MLQGCLNEVKSFFLRKLYVFGIVAIVIGVIQVWLSVTIIAIMCVIVYQQQFDTWTVCTKRRLKSHFLACVLMIDSVTPFTSCFAHEGH